MSEMQFVYVLTNSYVPNIVKIGWTARDPSVRAKEISQGTGVVGKWEVEYQWHVENGYWLEQRIFHELSEYRIQKSEMFTINHVEVYGFINSFISLKGATPKQAAEIKRLKIEEEKTRETIKSEIQSKIHKLIEIESKEYENAESNAGYFVVGCVVLICCFIFYNENHVFGGGSQGFI